MQPSVDGTSPVAADVYQDLWNLQSILQNPWGCMVNNDLYKGATDLIEEALRVMAATPIKVVSRSTAVPPKGGPAHSLVHTAAAAAVAALDPCCGLEDVWAYRHSHTSLRLLQLEGPGPLAHGGSQLLFCS